MSKKELIDDLSSMAGGIPKKTVEAVLDALAAKAQQAMSNGQEINLPGVGKLAPVTRAARTGRNPKTGDPVHIPERWSVKFKPSSTLKAAL
jgi:nucleoid DNA-binding protein